MTTREIIEIDEELCDGCGQCATACAEGAIEIIDGKAKLVSEVYCDGLGACIGHCPQGALTVVSRECADFDEDAVEARLQRRDPEPPAIGAPLPTVHATSLHGLGGGGCPGSRATTLRPSAGPSGPAAHQPSQLGHWPIQLHLVPPTAPFFQGADVLLAADCTAFALGAFHQRFLKDHALAIACPKLDSHQEIYLDKLAAMIDHAGIRSLTVAIMEVPCCGGLRRLAEQAVQKARRPVPLRTVVVGVRGDILADTGVIERREEAGDLAPAVAVQGR